MSLACTFLIVDGIPNNEYSNTKLEVGDNCKWYDELEIHIRECGRDILDLHTCKEDGYGTLTQDPYGKPIKTLAVEDLLKFYEHFGDRIDRRVQGQAAFAYLKCLSKNQKVAIYWH